MNEFENRSLPASQNSLVRSAFLFLMIWLICFVVGQLAVLLYISAVSSGGKAITGLEDMLFLAPGVLRRMILINSALTFLLPGLLFARVGLGAERWAKLGFRTAGDWRILPWFGLLILSSYPIIIWLTKVNAAIPLPDWLSFLDSSQYELLEIILTMDSMWALAFNLVLIGILPALGEEIIFRGVVQQGMARWLGNVHFGIVVSGLFFSLIHFQFDGLLARWLLGVILGYSFYFSGTLWVPIILHFLNNSAQVLLAYVNPEMIDTLDTTTSPELPAAVYVLSIVVAAGIIGFLTKSITITNSL